MKKVILANLAIGLLAVAAMPAQAATTIDFDGGSDGALVGAQYAAQGVTFSNTQFTNNLGLVGSSGTFAIIAPGTYQFGSDNAIVGTFSSLVSSITIRGLDVGVAGIRIDAFDAANNLLAFNTYLGSGAGVGTFADISVAASGISRFAVYQPKVGVGDGVLFDNLSFEPDMSGAVPEPATWAMMLLGFAFVGGALRSARNKKLTVTFATA